MMALLRLFLVLCHFIGFLASPIAQNDFDPSIYYDLYDYDPNDPNYADLASLSEEEIEAELAELAEQKFGEKVTTVAKGKEDLCFLPPEVGSNGK